MNTCYLDSNILVYLKDDLSPHKEKTIRILARLLEKGSQLFISPLVLDEFIYAFKYGLERRHSKDVYGDLKRAISEILDIPSMNIVCPPVDITHQLEVINYMKKYKLSPRDAYHLLTIKSNKIDAFATFDSNFAKVFADKTVKNAVD